MAAAPSMARPWNPDFKHSDRERWVCVYPAYINSKKTIAEGRRIPKAKAVENPTYAEIRDVCAAAGLMVGVENKVYSREQDARDVRFRGRIRVQLKDDDGKPILEQFPTRDSLFVYLGEMIPKLKSRQGGAGTQGSQQPTSQGGGKKKKGNKKK